MMLRSLLMSLLLVGVALPSGAAETTAPEEHKPDPAVIERNRALRVAKGWVKLLDDGKYALSWTEGARFLQEQIPQDVWVRGMTGGRGPAGRVKSRKLLSVRYQTAYPGAPEGEYMVVQFDTVFASRPTAREVVTPMRDPDGKWRVAIYRVE